MPNARVPADAEGLPDEAAGFAVLGRALDLARLVATVLDERLLGRTATRRPLSRSTSPAGAQLARARRLVAELQARRAEITRDCWTIRRTMSEDGPS